MVVNLVTTGGRPPKAVGNRLNQFVYTRVCPTSEGWTDNWHRYWFCRQSFWRLSSWYRLGCVDGPLAPLRGLPDHLLPVHFFQKGDGMICTPSSSPLAPLGEHLRGTTP
jgi:hypothetical protein